MDRALTDPATTPPARVSRGAEVLRSGATVDGEPEVLLLPGGMRIKGPGRKERAYQGRIADLEQALEAGRRDQELERRELEVARLVERGTGRLADRLEGELDRERELVGEVRAQGHRLMVALGALQRENEGLQRELQAARARLAAPAPRRTLLGRLLGR